MSRSTNSIRMDDRPLRSRSSARLRMNRVGGQPLVRLFSEVRLHRASDGGIRAIDVSGSEYAWNRYVDRLGAVELVARVGPPDSLADLDVGRIHVRPLPYYSGLRQLLRRLPRLLWALRDATSGASLCIFRLPGTTSLLGAAWCRVRRRRYVVEVVGDPVGVLESGVLGRVGRLTAPACGLLMRWAIAGACAGRYVTEVALQAGYPLATGAAEFSYSNVNLTADDFTPTPRLNPGPIRRLIAVGSQDQLYKGHDDLIRAVALLSDSGLRLQLGLVGDGRYHDALRQLACSCGVEDQVTFHGRVNVRADLHRLLDESDLFCMPSRTEGLPRALIEAMARGLPAIGTSVGGIPELIEPQHCARPSDPEALAELVAAFATGTVNLKEASHKVWQTAKRFAPDQQASRAERWLDAIALLAKNDS